MRIHRSVALLTLTLFAAGCGGAEADLQRGNRAYRRGDFEQAAGHYRRAIENEQTRTVAAFNLGKLLAQDGRWLEAREQFQIALERKGDNPQLLYYLGQAELALGHAETAKEYWMRSLKWYPETSGAGFELARLEAKEKNYQVALDYLQPLIDQPAWREQAVLLAVDCHSALGQQEFAISLVRSLLKTHSFWPESHLALGRLLLEKGDYPGANQAYQAALKRNNKLPEGLYGLGRALEGEGHPKEAALCYTKALEIGGADSPWAAPAREGLSRLATRL